MEPRGTKDTEREIGLARVQALKSPEGKYYMDMHG